MRTRSIRSLATAILAVALGLGLSSCGGDSESPTSATPSPDVSGYYDAEWRLQVVRKSDGFQKLFQRHGDLTIVQQAATRSISSLRGFAVMAAGGPPSEPFELRGSVNSEGQIEFSMDAPRPPEGPCPGGKDVHFAGQFSHTGIVWYYVSVRGETNVTCPESGDHTVSYMIRATRRP